MSMRVFYAYLFKENAEFKDIYEARKYLNELKEKFIEWVPHDMVKWSSMLHLDEMNAFAMMRQLEKDTKDPTNGGIWDYQLQCTMFAREVEGTKYIAFQFFPSNRVVKFLEQEVKLREFWYENQTDEGFDLPDWELRSTFWNAVYDEYWTPSKAGFTCDIYDGTDFYTTDKIIRNFEKLESKTEEGETCSETN